MTPTPSAVRAACDAERPSRNPCTWPKCGCEHDEMIGTMDAALANARAEGAAGEREAAAALADEWAQKNLSASADLRAKARRRFTQEQEDMAHAGADELQSCARECEALAAAIRARAAKEASAPTPPENTR